jgi:cell wall assembly regulator SMI1
MEIINPNPYGCLNVERLEKFENDIGVTLPMDDREFLLEYNGSLFLKKLFHISLAQGDSLIHHVYGLHDGPAYMRLDTIREIFRGRIPVALISIADDEGGNQICIDIRGKQVGSIYFWDHETNELFFLSPTFNKFVECLIEIPISENEIEKLLKSDDIDGLASFIAKGYDIEALDESGRSLIERAAIEAKPRFIEFLAKSGAKFRRSLEIAERNAKYFDEHRQIVELLIKLQRERK